MSRLHVIVPVHERPEWLEVCLQSLALQDHPDFEVTIVDDASSDPGVLEVARRFADRGGWRVVRSPERHGALASRCRGFEAAAPDDDETVVFVDGDDWLFHAGALRSVHGAVDGDVWLASGDMVSVATEPKRRRRAVELDELVSERRRVVQQNAAEIAATNSYRSLPWFLTPPIAFRAFLWRSIDPGEFRLSSGRWIRTCTDVAFMHPLLERCGGRFTLLQERNYVYNLHSGNVDADPTRHRAQVVTKAWLRSRPPLEPLDPGSRSGR